jgi:hypothetical protein
MRDETAQYRSSFAIAAASLMLVAFPGLVQVLGDTDGLDASKVAFALVGVCGIFAALAPHLPRLPIRGRGPDLLLVALAVIVVGGVTLLAVSEPFIGSVVPLGTAWLPLAIFAMFAVTMLCVDFLLRRGTPWFRRLTLASLATSAIGGALASSIAITITAWDTRVGIYPQFRASAVFAVAIFAVLALLLAAYRRRLGAVLTRCPSRVIGLAAAALVMALSLPLIQVNGAIVDSYHSRFVINELAAVSGGLLPGWDFVSQYTTGLPYVTGVLVSLLGLAPHQGAILTVTLANFAIVAVLFLAFRLVCPNASWALLALIPCLAAWCFSAGAAFAGPMTYWQVGPVRYLVLIPLIVGSIVLASRREMLTAVPVAGIAASGLLINVEWGIAVVLALALTSVMTSDHSNWRALGRGLILLAVTCGVVGALALAQWLGGAPAGVMNSVAFLRWAALDGALAGGFVLPLGPHWVVIAVFVLALGLGVQGLRGHGDWSGQKGRLAALSTSAGAFGLMASSYFFYRPFGTTGTALYLPWAFASTLVLIGLLTGRATRAPSLVTVSVAPLVVFAALPLASLPSHPPVTYSVSRVIEGVYAGEVVPSVPTPASLAAYRLAIDEAGGAPIGIISLYSPVDAAALGLEAAIPYNAHEYTDAHVFGAFWCRWLRGRYGSVIVQSGTDTPSVRQALQCAGYRELDRQSGVAEWGTWV